MKLCIRSFDLGLNEINPMIDGLNAHSLDGVQLVCYKTFPFIKYEPDGLSADIAQAIGSQLKNAGKIVPLIGAYFNPVHSDKEKAARCERIFCEYLKLAKPLGGCYVGSETGSFNDDVWSYHPQNRTNDALKSVVNVFSRLCEKARLEGSGVAIEGAAGHVCYSPDVLNTAVREIGDEKTKVIFDLYNYLDGDNHSGYLHILDRGLELFGDKILLFHLKDFVIDGGKLVQVAPGKGLFDYRAIFKRIKAHNKNAVLVFEGVRGGDIAESTLFVRRTWDSV